MSLPETCPFCGADKFGAESPGRWVTFVCSTIIHAGQDARRTQSRTCERWERTRLSERIAELEDETEALRYRLAELEAEAKQAREDEAWAIERTVLVEFQPVTSGWYASAPDGVVGINATAPTIHGALRALREKMEAKP